MTWAATDPDTVSVRVIDLATWSQRYGRDEVIREILSPAEVRRMDRLRQPGLRSRYACSHVALRCLLGARLGVPPRSLEFGSGVHGKPRFIGVQTDLEFNLSHSRGIALVAMSSGRPVGVDVEHVDRGRPGVPPVAIRFFPRDEADTLSHLEGSTARLAFTRLWARKEACVKATGGTLLAGLALQVGFPGEQGVVVGGPDPRLSERPEDPITWRVKDLAVAPGCCAAVALSGSADYDVAVSPLLVPEDILTLIRDTAPDRDRTSGTSTTGGDSTKGWDSTERTGRRRGGPQAPSTHPAGA